MEALCTYPYMPRLRDRRVLDEGVVDMPMLWQTDAFALAAAYDEAAGRYVGLWAPTSSTSAPVVNDAMLLVRPDVAQPQLDEEVKPAPTTLRFLGPIRRSTSRRSSRGSTSARARPASTARPR